MKRVIDGLVYNTETAKLICSIGCNAYKSDFRWHETALYRTPKGRYFLAGKGNASSMWARRVCDAYGAGEGMRVLSSEEAREYAEREDLGEEEMRDAGFEIADA